MLAFEAISVIDSKVNHVCGCCCLNVEICGIHGYIVLLVSEDVSEQCCCSSTIVL